MARRNLLPVLRTPSAPRQIQPSKAGKWRTGVLIAVHLLIAAHIAHWLVTGHTVTPVEPSEAMAYSKAGIVNAGFIFFAAMILLTAIFGRWFCGWACHVVALQDGSLWLLNKMGIRPKALRSRLLAWVPVFAFLYMFIWPAAWRLWHGDRLDVRGTELMTSEFWATFPGWIVGGLTFLVCGFVAVYFLGAKGFCTYACPYGAAFTWADKVAPMRIRVTDACEGCGHCTAVCTSNVRVHEEVRDFGMVVDNGCMKCGDCISVCPNDALYFGVGKLPLFAKPRGPEPATRRFPLTWGEELFAAAAFLVTFFAFRGLFGYVPFLMALGLAGSLAFVLLLGLRLLRRPTLAFRHRELKRAGRWTPAGRLAGAIVATVVLATALALALQAQLRLAEQDFAAFAGLRARTLDLSAEDPSFAEPSAAERQRVEQAAVRFERVERWSPVAWLGIDSRLAWTRHFTASDADFDRAVRRADARGDSLPELRLLAAIRAIDRGGAAEAAALLERAREEGFARLSSAEAWAALAMRAARAGAMDTARQLFSRGQQLFPDSVPLLYNSAVVAAIQGQTEAAIRGFQRVLELQPGQREASENLAGMLASAGRFDEAAKEFQAALRRSPEDVDLWVMYGRALLAAGRKDEAGTAFAEALRRDPTHALASELLSAAGRDD